MTLAHNALCDLREAHAVISALPCVESLTAADNPICSHENCRMLLLENPR